MLYGRGVGVGFTALPLAAPGDVGSGTELKETH